MDCKLTIDIRSSVIKVEAVRESSDPSFTCQFYKYVLHAIPPLAIQTCSEEPGALVARVPEWDL
jgi:hypothetical protein